MTLLQTLLLSQMVTAELWKSISNSGEVTDNNIVTTLLTDRGQRPVFCATLSLDFVFHQDNVLFQHEDSSFCCNGITYPLAVPKFTVVPSYPVHTRREKPSFSTWFIVIYIVSAQLADTTSRQWHNLRLDKMTPLCSVETWRQDTRCIAQTRHCLLLSIQTTTSYRKCRVNTSF